MQTATMKETAAEQARCFVVLNPMAGNCTADEVRQVLERHLGGAGYTYHIYETTGKDDEDVVAVVRAAVQQGSELVVAIGGDGTVSDAAEALAQTSIPLGIIPVGTANVFAQELGIPLDLEQAFALLSGSHTITSIDAMQVGERWFVLQIGVGIDSLMIRDTERSAKRLFGRAAYLWTACKWLVGYQPRRFTVVVDGRNVRVRAAQVLVANGGVLGVPPLRWGPHIRPDDGRIDVCIISASSIRDFIGVAWYMLRGLQRYDPRVRYLSATEHITITSDRSLPVQADGEIIGQTPLTIQVKPAAVRVVVPEELAV